MQDQVVIFDTTLRDGEQSPGVSLNSQEKLQIAQQLATLKVDIIEAGFPISSKSDFEAVSRVSGEVEGSVICGLARALEQDIVRCWEAIKHAQKSRIHVFIGTSDIHLKGQLKKDRTEVLKMVNSAVQKARSLCEDVEFSAMDASRTELGYLCEVIESAIDAGARVINIPDTVGYAMPDDFAKLISDIKEKTPNINKAILSVHCHDDLGMAVPNSLFAVKSGVRQIECTINGVGERAGNASLEEIVMALNTRQDYFNLKTGVNTREIYPTSRLVSRLMDMPVSPNKAIVGSNAFAHSSGIHQDGVLKERTTYEIMKPDEVGIRESRMVLTPRSGRHALKHKLKELGFDLSEEQLEKTYERFLTVADKKGEIFDEDLIAIMHDEIIKVPETYTLEYLHTFSGIGAIPTATVKLKAVGKTVQEVAWGDGPVDAIYKAINKATGLSMQLENYSIRSVTKGPEAMGEVSVKLFYKGNSAVGHGTSTDIMEASARAYIDGINKLVMREKNFG